MVYGVQMKFILSAVPGQLIVCVSVYIHMCVRVCMCVCARVHHEGRNVCGPEHHTVTCVDCPVDCPEIL